MKTIDLDQKLQFDLQRDLVGRRIAILGDSGQGKTNTAAVLAEELLAAGLPLTIVDFKGEYRDLRRNHQIRVTGLFPQADLQAGPGEAASLAALSVAEGLSMLLDLSAFTANEQIDFLLAYFASLWAATNKKRTPYGLIIEESSVIHHEEAAAPLKELLNFIVLNGHQRGLGTILLDRLSSGFSPDFFRQQEILFLQRVVHPAERQIYKDLIPLPAEDIEDLLNRLRPGQAIAVYNSQVRLLGIKQWQNDTVNPELIPAHQAHLAQESLPLATQLQRNHKKLLDAMNNGENEAGVDRAYALAKELNHEAAEWLQNNKKALHEDLDRLNTIITEQSLLLATLKDLKVYLETQSTGPTPAQGFTPAVPKSEPFESQQQPKQRVETGAKGAERIIQFPTERHSSGQIIAKSEPARNRGELNDHQLRKLKPFLYRLNDLSNKEVMLVSFLLAHEGLFYTRLEIFKFTGLFTGNFYHDFKTLLKMPFVEEEVGPPVRFGSKTKQWAINNFQGIDPDTVIQTIKDYL